MIEPTLLMITNMNPSKLYLGDRCFHLVEAEPTYTGLTEAQATTYRLLAALAHLGSEQHPHTIETALLVKVLGLADDRPLQKRLSNLEKKGKIQVQEVFANAS